jgi:hypothetical protein
VKTVLIHGDFVFGVFTRLQCTTKWLLWSFCPLYKHLIYIFVIFLAVTPIIHEFLPVRCVGYPRDAFAHVYLKLRRKGTYCISLPHKDKPRNMYNRVGRGIWGRYVVCFRFRMATAEHRRQQAAADRFAGNQRSTTKCEQPTTPFPADTRLVAGDHLVIYRLQGPLQVVCWRQ